MNKEFEVSQEECKQNHSEFVANVFEAIEPFMTKIKDSDTKSIVLIAQEVLSDKTIAVVGVAGTSKNIISSVIKLAEQSFPAKMAMGIVTMEELLD